MNDVERGLRDLGERAKEDVRAEPRLRPSALRRIRRRRAVASTTVLTCAATVVAAGAFAWTAQDERRAVMLPPPAAESPSTEGGCSALPFEPTYVPHGFDGVARPPAEGRPGSIATFASDDPASIEVTTPHYAFPQTRPRPVEVLGSPGTIGVIHEGFSVEFHHGECEYVLNGYGVTKSELKRFAEGLAVAGQPPAGEPGIVIWPEDTEEDAATGCADAEARERTAPAVVSGFATEVLGWDAPIYEAPRSPSGPWTVTPFARDTYGGEVEAGVLVWTTEIVPGCFSITSVSRLGDRRPTGVGVSVRGQTVEVTYDALGATAASAEIGYGGHSREVFDRRGRGSVRMRLGYRPETTGHVFILLRDEDGDVFTAYGFSLPEGDFTAG